MTGKTPEGRRDLGRWKSAAPMLGGVLLVSAVVTVKWLAHDPQAREEISQSPLALLAPILIALGCLFGAFQALFWYRSFRDWVTERLRRR